LKKHVLLILALFIIVSCGKDTIQRTIVDKTKVVHTGDVAIEDELGDVIGDLLENKTSLESKTFYISATKLRVRSSPNTANTSNVLGELLFNAPVKVLAGQDLPAPFVEITFEQEGIHSSEHYYVSVNYLNEKKALSLNDIEDQSYFMIQNVATEILRIYQRRCDGDICRNHMMMETELAVGEDSKKMDTRTVVGFMQISEWFKFYMDGAGTYTPWYDANYMMPPKAKSSVLKWAKKKYLTPLDAETPREKAGVRGAFGWYTAKLKPDAHYQWVHGTIGWGSDKKKYIKTPKQLLANLVLNPRSHGCSRTDNESIAYIRELIIKGTPVIKIYAKEAILNTELTSYPDKTLDWEYILTKIPGQKADRYKVIMSGVSEEDYLEEGTYSVDTYPSAVKFNDGAKMGRFKRKLGSKGNVYGIEAQNMKGIFYIDEGLLSNYMHPSQQEIIKVKADDKKETIEKVREIIVVGGVKKADNKAVIPEYIKIK
jgi:hypothetical protein